jgi:KRAB domain-containing zinc finger protein
MKGHFKTHTMPGETMNCNLCDYSTPNERMFKYHMKTHSGIKYTCDECGKSFNLKSSVISHKAVKHSGKLYLCDECDFTCKGHRHDLETHKLIKHGSTSASIIECEEQNVKALMNNKLLETNNKDNETRRDQDDVRFTCYEEGCTFSSNHKQSLKVHTNAKHLGTKYKCDICDYISGHLSNVKKHKGTRHLGINHKCELCEYTSVQLSNVKKHTIIKHKFHSCTTCSFRCLDLDMIQRHMSEIH